MAENHKTRQTSLWGSGCFAGAYVTLEHEYILIFRKGGKRSFLGEHATSVRQKSAIFWEERNVWFSDIWAIQGVRQSTNSTIIRERSAAYPFELAYRLVHMYSVKGDIVLDPFWEQEPPSLPRLLPHEKSIGIDIDEHFSDVIREDLPSIQEQANTRIQDRLLQHKGLCTGRIESQNGLKYTNRHHRFPVMTRQEQGLEVEYVERIMWDENLCIQVEYHPVGILQEFVENPLAMGSIVPSQHEQIAMF